MPLKHVYFVYSFIRGLMFIISLEMIKLWRHLLGCTVKFIAHPIIWAQITHVLNQCYE